MKKIKKIPLFKNEDEERIFWATHSPLDFPDSFEPVVLHFPNLASTTQKKINLSLPTTMVSDLKNLANKHKVSYQSLIKTFLGEKIKEQRISPR